MSQREALQAALKYLLGRDRTLAEIERHLMKDGFGAEVRQEVVAELLSSGYLDELRVVERALEEARRKLEGLGRFRETLQRRGLAEDLLLTAMERLAAEEPELARRTLDRYRAQRGRMVTAARAAGYLARRGFSPEVIEELLQGESF